MQSTPSNNKVSVKQLILMLMVITISPAVRYLPSYAAIQAEEAGWLSPFAAIPPVILVIYLIQRIFGKYKDNSAPEIIKDILGPYIGTAALILHFIWIFVVTGIYIRFNAERLVSSIYPNIDISFFIVTTLLIVAIIVRSGETVLARAGEVLFPILFFILIFIMLLLIPGIRADALLPIASSDIFPIIKASIGTISLYSYLFFMFLFSENIVGRENIRKLYLKGSSALLIMLFMILFTAFGRLGSSVTARTPIPFLVTVKQVSIADTIENIESVVVATWMLSDALLIATTTLMTLNIAKGTFHLSDSKNHINIFLVFQFILASVIAKNRVELDLAVRILMTYVMVTLGFGTPALLFIAGKLRRKL